MSARVVIVDFVADVVCPWCYVGWRSFRQMRAMRPELAFTIHWQPFLLNPHVPPEGIDRLAFYAERAKADPERFAATRAALIRAAAEADAPLDIEAARVMPNTIDAHRLIYWAAGQSLTEQAVDAIFEAFFVRGENIGAPAVLMSIGASIGLDEALLAELLASEADRARIVQAHNAAIGMGVSGVPVLIFDRKTAALGADKPEAYMQALDQALAAAAP